MAHIIRFANGRHEESMKLWTIQQREQAYNVNAEGRQGAADVRYAWKLRCPAGHAVWVVTGFRSLPHPISRVPRSIGVECEECRAPYAVTFQ